MFSIVNFKVYIANKILKWHKKNVENICMHIHHTLRPHLVKVGSLFSSYIAKNLIS